MGPVRPAACLSRAEIGPLGPGAVANNIVVTAKARGVPRREQYSALVVEEQTGQQNFHDRGLRRLHIDLHISRAKQNGGVGSQDAGIGDGNITFEGATLRGRGPRRRVLHR